MKTHNTLLTMALLVASGSFLIAANQIKGGSAKKAEADTDIMGFIRPGLHAEFLEITTNNEGVVSVTFSIKDDFGGNLDLDGLRTPGPISANFILGYIPAGQATYSTLSQREVTSPITGTTAMQPTSDSGGVMEKVSNGVYRYTLATPLPEGFDPNVTYTLGAYIARDLRDFNMDRISENIVQGFVPSGEAPQPLRDIVRTETCNDCHHNLGVHGGIRNDVALCIMCHYPGVIDPDTGNSVDMAVMTHKIHAGANLPSVQAGTPYQIIGYRQSVHDYSGVAFPQDIRNCAACHKPDVNQPEDYINHPTRDNCGSCHDDVNYITGENHFGLPQDSDARCSTCHFKDGPLEYLSILGAHALEYRSNELEGIQIDILNVLNTTPGNFPEVHFTLMNNDGANIDPSTLAFFNFIMAGPNTDFHFQLSQRAVESSVWVDDHYVYNFTEPIPEDAIGSYTMGAEAFRMVTLKEMSYRETAENPLFAFAVTDVEAVPRRTIVSDEKCEKCHDNLALHGTIRHNPDYCVTCHYPEANDSPYRDPSETARTIDFKFMIHRIHKGSELLDDYTIIGFGGHEVNYNHVEYPGILSECQACHENKSYMGPAQGSVETIAPYEFFSPIPPTSAACLGCHDSIDAASHAYTNITSLGESCEACHGAGKPFAVDKVHGAN